MSRADREYLKKVGHPAGEDGHRMRAFRRAVGYMLPYKARLTGVALCVAMIAVLWATGLSIILPAAKIFFSDEGLHGWVDKRAVERRLDVELDNVSVGQNRQEAWGHITRAAIVRKVGENLAPAGAVARDDYLLGIDGKYMEFEPLMRELAAGDGRASWQLLVYRSADDRAAAITVGAGPVGAGNRFLMWAVNKMPRPKGYSDRFGLFLWVLGVSLVLNVVRDIFRIIQDYLVQTTVQRAMIDLRRENYATALRMPMSYYATSGTSDTISRFIADIHQLGQGLITLFGKTLVEPAKLIGAFVLALILSWKLTLLACVAGPPTYILIRKMGALMRRNTKKVLQSQGRMLRTLSETLQGVRVVKAYTTEAYEEQHFKQITRQLYQELKPMSASDAVTGPAIESLGIAAAMVAAAIAGYWVFQGQMEPVDFFVLLGVLAALFDPVRKLSTVITKFHASDAAAARVFELRDRPVERDVPGAIDLPRHRGTIEFRHVTFTYANAATPSLKDVSLKFAHGQCVAVVGGNGSGKTTLLSMLPRFFQPPEGQVLIDGQDIAAVTLTSLRGQIGLVTQETVLFNATIGENIAYGCADATPEQIVAAARQAFVDEFVSTLPDGYDTMVGEHGATLSGGQRQRIAIARVILRDPAILILDEAMSQIDSESESKIHQALESFMAGRTTVTIAHRFSTVIGADSVVVMEGGRIVDVGSHGELLARCRTYRLLFETQLVAGPTE